MVPHALDGESGRALVERLDEERAAAKLLYDVADRQSRLLASLRRQLKEAATPPRPSPWRERLLTLAGGALIGLLLGLLVGERR